MAENALARRVGRDETQLAGASAHHPPPLFSIVCISSQDWEVELPTNRQQIMSRAARLGHEVLFVESGRWLGWHLYDLVRARNRRSLVRRLVSSERVAPRLRVRKAINLLPWAQRSPIARHVNAFFTGLVVRGFGRHLPQPFVVWLYDPISASLVGRAGEALAAYDCVDDYAEQAGDDPRRRENVARADEEAARRARIVFVTTPSLRDRHALLNPRVELVPNVADFDHFAAARGDLEVPHSLASLPSPRVGFVGNLTPLKVDFALVEHLAATRPRLSVVLVGPVQRDARAAVARLGRYPNVHLVGPQPYAVVPSYVAGLDVCIIPYATNAYTRSCFPLKLYEYLAAGRPVVASGLPALRRMEPDVVVADSAAAFVDAVDAALEDRDDLSADRRVALAAGHTWEHRTTTLIGFVSSSLVPAAELTVRKGWL